MINEIKFVRKDIDFEHHCDVYNVVADGSIIGEARDYHGYLQSNTIDLYLLSNEEAKDVEWLYGYSNKPYCEGFAKRSHIMPYENSVRVSRRWFV